MNSPDRYAPEFVRELFAGMAATYGVVNLVSSFGFCARWRRQCVALAGPREGMVVYDLMSGMGECWPAIASRVGREGRIVGVDFSPAMCDRAERARERVRGPRIELLRQDFLANDIPDASADCVVSSFGLKTFDARQRDVVAREVARILKPGGRFALLEISVPKSGVLRGPYLFYLKHCIPWIGAAFLGNPDHYRLLGVYTESFVDCSSTRESMMREGLEVTERGLFLGCATAVVGRRPGSGPYDPTAPSESP